MTPTPGVNTPLATKETVQSAMMQLIIQKKNPGQESIQAITGGSMRTVVKLRNEILAEWEEQGAISWPQQVPEEFIEEAVKLFSAAKVIAGRELDEYRDECTRAVAKYKEIHSESLKELKDLEGSVVGLQQEIASTEGRNQDLEEKLRLLTDDHASLKSNYDVERARWQERGSAFEREISIKEEAINRMLKKHVEELALKENQIKDERDRTQLEIDRVMQQLDDAKQARVREVAAMEGRAEKAESSAEIFQSMLESSQHEVSKLRAKVNQLNEQGSIFQLKR